MTHHTLTASPETTHWGCFDAALPPVLEVRSGDTVTIETVSGPPSVLPEPGGLSVPPELLAIHAAQRETPIGPHFMTGPVAVAGARPGDTLEVRILEVEPRSEWGFNLIRPGAGTLPDDYPDWTLQHIHIDPVRRVGRLPYGLELELRPFFGILGVAPPPEWGRITSVVPRDHGGNLDNTELVAGTSLFLPVFVPGALFSCGDGHGLQGDGEVCVTAIETALRGTFTLVLHPGHHLERPRAETPTHLITMGMDPDLDRCVEIALRDMITLVCDRSSLSRAEAYQLCSLVADMRITQTVNESKGVHCMFPRSVLGRLPGATPRRAPLA